MEKFVQALKKRLSQLLQSLKTSKGNVEVVEASVEDHGENVVIQTRAINVTRVARDTAGSRVPKGRPGEHN